METKLKFIFKISCLSFFLLLSSCISKGRIEITLFDKSKTIEPFNVSVANVQVLNHQVIITGTNLDAVTAFKIQEGANTAELEIESQTNTSIVANTLSNVTFAAGKVFDFILSNANAASTFTVNFSLCDSSLGGKGFDCLVVPNDKDVLSFDAATNKWVPRNVNGLTYKGTFDASPGVDPLGSPLAGDYYLVSTAGTINTVSYLVGDWIVYNQDDLAWQKVSNSKDVLSVFGRTGKISAKEGDYSLTKMSDVDLTTVPPVLDQILKFNGTNWVPGTAASAAAAGTVTAPGYSFSGNTNTGFYSPAANQIGITNNGVESVRIDAAGNVGIGTTAPNALLDILGTNAVIQQSSGTGGLKQVESGTVRSGINLTDSLVSIFNGANSSGTGNSILLNDAGATAGDYVFNVPAGTIRQVSFRNIGGGWTGAKMVISKAAGANSDGTFLLQTTGHAIPQLYLDAVGNVGVGTTTPGSTLDVKGTLRLSGSTSGYVGFAPAAAAGSTTYTLPVADGTAGQALTTNASGVLSWATVAGAVSGTSGGIPYYDSATTMASSAQLGQYGLVIGGGAGGAPSTIGTGVAGQYVKSAGVGTPAFSYIVMGDLKDGLGLGGNLFPNNCTAAQTYVYSVLNGSFSCANITAAASLSSLSAATATNTIDNLNFNQVWNWTTATTESLLTMAANALTTGSILNISTSNGTLNSTNGLLNVANTGASTNGVLARFQANSTAGSGVTVLTSGRVGIGTANPAFDVDASGKTIRLDTLSLETAGNIMNLKVGTDGSSQKYLGIGSEWTLYDLFGMNFDGLNSVNFTSMLSGSSNGWRAGSISMKQCGEPAHCGDMKFEAGGASNQLYLSDNGNVGIGTNTPLARLDIGQGNLRMVNQNSAAMAYSIGAKRHGSPTQDDRLVFTSSGTPNGSRFWFDSPNGSVGFSMAYNGTEKFFFGADNSNGFSVLYSSYLYKNGATTIATMTTAGRLMLGGSAAPLSSLDVNGGAAIGTYAGTSAAPANSLIVSGNVGVGTTTPSEKLHVVGNLRVQGSTDCTLGNGAGGTNCSSDIRLKENIQAIKDPLRKILSLKGVEFDWNEKSNSPGSHAIGVIAQDIEKVFPTAVIQDPTTGYKKVDYAVLVAPIIQAFKEFNKFITSLFSMSNEHGRDIASLNKKSAKLEAENALLKVRADKVEKENKALQDRLDKVEKILLKK